MNHLVQMLLVLFSLGTLGSVSSQDSALGLFEKHGDIGAARKPGSVEYDAAKKSYRLINP